MRKDGPVAILWPANGRPPERNERWAPRRRCRQSHLRLPDQPEEVDEDKSLTAVSDRCPVAVHRHRATDESVSPRGPSPYASPPPTALFPNYRPPSRLACSAGKSHTHGKVSACLSLRGDELMSPSRSAPGRRKPAWFLTREHASPCRPGSSRGRVGDLYHFLSRAAAMSAQTAVAATMRRRFGAMLGMRKEWPEREPSDLCVLQVGLRA